MKILVLSDSHSFDAELKEILKKERTADMIIHLGDGSDDLYDMSKYTAGKPVYYIKGNCDAYAYDFPQRIITFADKFKIFACHGHMYNVKFDIMPLYYAAKQEGCDIALFGHTHIPFSEAYDGVHIFNPGCAKSGSYGIIEIKDGSFSLSHRSIFQV